MTKKKAGALAPVTKVIRCTGLKVYEEVIVHDPSSPEGVQMIMSLLESATPAKRLSRLRKRCEAHSEVNGVSDELEWIQDNIKNQGLAIAVSFALTALERGIDLLDTEKYSTSLQRDTRRQAGTRIGADRGNAYRAKIKDAPELLAALKSKLAAGNSLQDAKSSLRVKYGVTRQTLNARLKKAQVG